MQLPADTQAQLDALVARLLAALGDNLAALVQYGSSVRGNYVPGASDINLLILLVESTPAAHLAIADAIRSKLPIDPFVLAQDGFERTARAFALKFRSIQRNHRLLAGRDPFEDLAFDDELLRFLTEQSLRNVRLRLVRAAILLRREPERHAEVLARFVPGLLVDLSSAARFAGAELPNDLDGRMRVLQSVLGLDLSVLGELLAAKSAGRAVTDVASTHARLFELVDRGVRWMEERWPIPRRSTR